MFLFGIAIFNTVTSFVKEAILMLLIGNYATVFSVENYVSLPASSKAKVRFSFKKKHPTMITYNNLQQVIILNSCNNATELMDIKELLEQLQPISHIAQLVYDRMMTYFLVNDLVYEN